MVSNGNAGGKMMQRKRKQVNTRANSKKFKNNFRGNNGGGGFSQAPLPRDQQRDFACDYIDFENFDAFDDTTQRSAPNFRPNPRGPPVPENNWDRPMRRGVPNMPHPYRESRPLLPLPPVPPMYGPARRPMPPLRPMPPMAMPPMIRPPMPMLPPRPLLRRPFRPPPPPPPFIPPGPILHGPIRPPMRGGRIPPGAMRGPALDRKRKFVKGPAPNRALKKGKKKVGVKPTPPQELNDMTKPWITDEIKEANAKKIELNKVATKTADPKDWKAFWEAREKVKTMVQAARLEYIGKHPDEDVEKILTDKSKVDEQNGDTNNGDMNAKTETGNTATLSQTVDKTDTNCSKVESMPTQSSEPQSTATNVAGDSSPSQGNAQIKTESLQVNEKPTIKAEPIQNSEAKALQAKEPQTTDDKIAPTESSVSVEVKSEPIDTPTPTPTPTPTNNTPSKPETVIEKVTPKAATASPKPTPPPPPTKTTPNRGGGRGGHRGRGNRGGRGGNNTYNTRTTRSMGGNYNQRGYY